MRRRVWGHAMAWLQWWQTDIWPQLVWPTNIWLQFAISLAFAALTLALGYFSWSRRVGVFVGTRILHGTRHAAAGVIWLFDKVMPIDGRNGRLPRANFATWILLNATIIAAWIATGEIAAAHPYVKIVAGVAAAFAVLNLVLLGASYWAVRETIEVTNGDRTEEADFKDRSPARNLVFVLATALLLVAHVAVVIDWVGHFEGITLVAVDGSIALPYLNALLATIDALPLASLFVAPLADHASLNTDAAGQAVHYGLAGLGSVVIIGAAVGLIQQRLVFQQMVDTFLKADDPPAALIERLKRLPPAVDSYISGIFDAAVNDTRRRKLVDLAIKRRTFGFPQTFAANYDRFGADFRDEGTRTVAGFIESHRSTIDEASLQALFNACNRNERNGFKRAAERRRIARVLVPALEALLERNKEDGQRRVGSKMIRQVLDASLIKEADPILRVRAARLVVAGRNCDLIPDVLRATSDFDDAANRDILRGIAKLLTDGTLPSRTRQAENLLQNIVACAQDAEGDLPASMRNLLGNIRGAANRRRRAERRNRDAVAEHEAAAMVAAVADQPTAP